MEEHFDGVGGPVVRPSKPYRTQRLRGDDSENFVASGLNTECHCIRDNPSN